MRPSGGHQAIEPQSEEGRQRRLCRLGDLQHDDPAARRHHPRHLRQAPIEIGEVARPKPDGGGIVGPVGVRQRERVGGLEANCDRGRQRLAPGELEHPLGEVAADHLASRRDARGELERQITGPSGDIERSGARPAAQPDRPPSGARRGAARRSSPSSSGRRAERCGRTSPAPEAPPAFPLPGPLPIRRSRSRGRGCRYCSSERKVTRFLNFCGEFCARLRNDGIGAVGLRSVEAIAPGRSFEPM